MATEQGDRELLLRTLERRPEPWLRADAARGLGILREPRAQPLLVQLLSNERTSLEGQIGAAFALGRLADPASLEPLLAALRRAGDPELRFWLLEALGQLCVHERVRLVVHDALGNLPVAREPILDYVIRKGRRRCAPPPPREPAA